MAKVRTGLDRWIEQGPSIAGLDAGARLGWLVHPASVRADGRHVLEWLADDIDARATRLFAPEHGLWGREQDMETVGEATDPWTGRPVHSLYGATPDSLRPRAEHLRDLDALVVDLQDVGARYYTFIYTMAYVMEVAVEVGLPVVVLDRPNPLGGTRTAGPILHREMASFVGRFPLPVEHGMTSGELARLFNDREGIGADLRVVPMEGWSRDASFVSTGLPWVPPSPNMPGTATVRVYPGGCLIEGTLLSEARGTTTPFELVGAPWLDARQLASRLRETELPGVAFRPAAFRPMFQKHAGELCQGVQVIVTDDAAFDAFRTYLALIVAARLQDPSRFAWREQTYEFESDRLAIDLLLGRTDLRPILERSDDIDVYPAMRPRFADEARVFDTLRADYLLY